MEVASWFTGSDKWEFEVIAAGASGDFAYTMAYDEHSEVVVDGDPRAYTLRVTHAYRREGGQWRIVHRHADFPPDPNAPLLGQTEVGPLRLGAIAHRVPKTPWLDGFCFGVDLGRSRSWHW